jgi:hypothetical protein
MKYNILTIASRSYYPFLDVFLNSLFKNCDAEKINKIYVVCVDFGDFKNDLIKSDKIVFIDDKNIDEYSGVHSDGWYKTTKLKTQYLKYVLNQVPEDEPVLMIDSDTMVLKDIYDVINLNYDIQITEMSAGSHISASGVLISHIACFMLFNNINKSKLFVDEWIKRINDLMEQKKPKPHETPAMNSIIHDEEFIKEYKIESLNDKVVCSDLSIFSETRIVHFKSNGPSNNKPVLNFINRIKNVRCFDINYMNLNYNDYINLDSFNRWTNDDINVTKENFYNVRNNYR